MGGKYRGQKRVHYKYKNYTSGLERKIYKILFDTDPPVLENILITRDALVQYCTYWKKEVGSIIFP